MCLLSHPPSTLIRQEMPLGPRPFGNFDHNFKVLLQKFPELAAPKIFEEEAHFLMNPIVPFKPKKTIFSMKPYLFH